MGIETSKKKKSKLGKILKRFIFSVIAIICVFITVITISIVKDEKAAKKRREDMKTTTTLVYDNKIDLGTDAVEPDMKAYDKRIKLSDSGLDTLEKTLYSYKADYDFKELYNLDATKARIERNNYNAVKKHKHDVRVDGKLNDDALYKIVKANNDEFIKNSTAFYQAYSDEDLRKYCKALVEIINDIQSKKPLTNMDEACCYLYDLKIVNKKGATDFAAIELSKRNLHINESTISAWSKLREPDKFSNEILYHEVMHILQCPCNCYEYDNELRIGACHKYEDYDYNPYIWFWLAEASAEMNACECVDMDYQMYKAKIGYVKSLNFMSNMLPSGSEARLQDFCFSRNMDDIYKLLAMDTDEEKEELIFFLYTMELLQSTPTVFEEWYSKKNNVELDTNHKARMHLTLKEDALTTMTRLFYRNLARCINAGDMSLQDVFTLMRIIESDIEYHITPDKVGYLIFFKNFYPNYLEMRKEFLEAISKENGISTNKLEDMFIGFTSECITLSNYSFISEAKRKAVMKYGEEIAKKNYPDMTEISRLCKEWLVKAPYEDLILTE